MGCYLVNYQDEFSDILATKSMPHGLGFVTAVPYANFQLWFSQDMLCNAVMMN